MWSPASLGYAGTGGARGAKDSELSEMLDVELFYLFASENARIIENMIRGSSTRDVLQTSLSILYQFESALWQICHPCLHIVSASLYCRR
jgi:hypothetical protein